MNTVFDVVSVFLFTLKIFLYEIFPTAEYYCLQAGYVVPSCDHQSIKEFTSIKNKMTITPVIYCRVNIYGRYGEMPGILHSYQAASKLFFHPTIVLLSITISSHYNIQRNTQNFRLQECSNIIMFAKS